MNNVNLVGRLVREPELKYGKDGKAILKTSIAVNRNKEQTDFINIVAFGKTAELIAEYHNKGDLIALSGAIWTGSYEKEGVKVYTFEVCVNQVTFVKSFVDTGKKEEAGTKQDDSSDSFPF